MVNAKDLLDKYGETLLGRTVFTQAVGPWPGGISRVVELYPDPNAPEILFNVRLEYGGGEIGVFDDQRCDLVP